MQKTELDIKIWELVAGSHLSNQLPTDGLWPKLSPLLRCLESWDGSRIVLVNVLCLRRSFSRVGMCVPVACGPSDRSWAAVEQSGDSMVSKADSVLTLHLLDVCSLTMFTSEIPFSHFSLCETRIAIVTTL